MLPAQETVTPYYVRFRVKDCHGVIAAISALFAKHDIGISAITSRDGADDEKGQHWNYLVFMLYACNFGRLESALTEIQELGTVLDKPMVLRIERMGTND